VLDGTNLDELKGDEAIGLGVLPIEVVDVR
jgi:hypothetical protein